MGMGLERYLFKTLEAIPPEWIYLNGFHAVLLILFIISYKARKIYLSNIKLPTFQVFKRTFITGLVATLIILAIYLAFALVGCNYSEMKFCSWSAFGGSSPIGGIESLIGFIWILLPIIIIYPLLTTFIIKTKKTGKFYRILFWIFAIALYGSIAVSYIGFLKAFN